MSLERSATNRVGIIINMYIFLEDLSKYCDFLMKEIARIISNFPREMRYSFNNHKYLPSTYYMILFISIHSSFLAKAEPAWCSGSFGYTNPQKSHVRTPNMC